MRDELTVREMQAAKLAVSGLSNRELAAQMSITEGTAKQYLHRVYEKTGTAGRFDLAKQESLK